MSLLLAVLLLVFGTTVQAEHAHPLGESHTDCALCITLHSTHQIAVPQIALLPPVAPGEPAQQLQVVAFVKVRRAHPLSIRPPPAASLIA